MGNEQTISDMSSRRKILKQAGGTGLVIISGSKATLAQEQEDTDDGFTKISDWHDLNAIRNDLDDEYVLVNDLDTDTAGYAEHVSNPDGGWNPIGRSLFQDGAGFSGTLNGDGHTIRNLVINRPDEHFVGLFGGTDHPDALIMDLKLENIDVRGDRHVGGIVGSDIGSSKIRQVTVDGEITGDRRVGGLVGHLSGVIENASVDANISGDSDIGSLVGRQSGDIKNSDTRGEVTGNSAVGGLVGRPLFGEVQNSHYNIDELMINDEKWVTIGGLFDNQYQDWIDSGKQLSVDDYEALVVADDNSIEISDPEGVRDALGFMQDPNTDWRLTADVDLSDMTANLFFPYLAGTLSGNDHTITVSIDTVIRCVGAVGVNDGTITNLTVDGTIRTSDRVAGGLVGRNRGAVIRSEVREETSVSGGGLVGTLVGENYGEVRESSANGVVTSESGAGGLVGLNSGEVRESTASSNVTGGGRVGGLVGENRGEITDSKVYSDSKIATEEKEFTLNIGGLVGENDDGVVRRSYATGTVEEGPEDDAGGLVGRNTEEAQVSGSYWDTNATNQSGGIGDGDGDATGLDTDQMQGAVVKDTMAALDFDETWQPVTDPEDYPILQAFGHFDSHIETEESDGDEESADESGNEESLDEHGNEEPAFAVPGFGVGSTLAGISGAAYLLRKRLMENNLNTQSNE